MEKTPRTADLPEWNTPYEVKLESGFKASSPLNTYRLKQNKLKNLSEKKC